MVKQRMSTADVAGEVACLRQSILGMRVANVYDVNAKVGYRTLPLQVMFSCRVDWLHHRLCSC